jgi:phospholipid transport system substrate-binding protein
MRLMTVLFALMLIVPGFAHAEKPEKVVMRPPAATSGGPSKVVEKFHDTLLTAMKDGQQLGFHGRFNRLKPAMSRAFNFSDMTKTSVGLNWVKASPEEKNKLIDAFREFSIANYASQYKKFEGENFTMNGEKPGPGEGEVIVETTLTSGDDKTNFHYLMRRNSAGAWQIEDIFVNGTISEMATRRSEFSSVVRDNGVPALIDMLEKKNEQLANS